jgi:hypothetical protein
MTGGTILSENGSFYGCSALEKVTFRGRTDGQDGELILTSVLFTECTSLRRIYMKRNTQAEISYAYVNETMLSTRFLGDCANNVYLYVYSSCVNYYQSGSNAWAKCGKIGRVMTITE